MIYRHGARVRKILDSTTTKTSIRKVVFEPPHPSNMKPDLTDEETDALARLLRD